MPALIIDGAQLRFKIDNLTVLLKQLKECIAVFRVHPESGRRYTDELFAIAIKKAERRGIEVLESIAFQVDDSHGDHGILQQLGEIGQLRFVLVTLFLMRGVGWLWRTYAVGHRQEKVAGVGIGGLLSRLLDNY